MAYKQKPLLSAVAKPQSNDPIYTLGEAAALLDCNEQTLADKFKKGEIKANKKLGKWFTTHSNLLAFINS